MNEKPYNPTHRAWKCRHHASRGQVPPTPDLRLGIFGLVSLVCDLWFGVFGLGSLIWDPRFEILGLGSLVRDLWFGIFVLGSLVSDLHLHRIKCNGGMQQTKTCLMSNIAKSFARDFLLLVGIITVAMSSARAGGQVPRKLRFVQKCNQKITHAEQRNGASEGNIKIRQGRINHSLFCLLAAGLQNAKRNKNRCSSSVRNTI